ncbi:hypothetical protein JCM10213_002831 [Rhodosporidiobolus nylandii]
MASVARVVTKPFVDSYNYIRPHLHEERGITSESALALARERRLSGGIGSSTILDDLEEVDADPFAPAAASTSSLTPTPETSPLPDLSASVLPPEPFESRQWKECTPVLEDCEAEEAAERSYFRRQAQYMAEDTEEADESFATAQRSLDLSVFESPEVCRARSHTWHALDFGSQESLNDGQRAEAQLLESPELRPLPLEDGDGSSSYSRTPSLAGDESTFDHASPRESEDSYTISTPNTSIPLSSPGCDVDWSPSPSSVKGKGKEREETFTFPTSTPPRAAPHFVEVIETAPTPEKDSPAPGAGARSRSLMTASGLGIDFERDAYPEDEAEQADRLSTRPTSAQSQYAASGASSEYHAVSTDDESIRPCRRQRVEVVEPSFDSYSSSVYPDAAHFDTYTRRPRRRTRPALFSADAPQALPFPEISPTDVVHALLSQPNGSTSHFPSAPAELPSPPIAPAPQHIRPITSPHFSTAPSTSYFPTVDGPQQRHVSDRSIASHHVPFADLVPAGASQPVLRAQASNRTLFTYDLHHLPAPNTPRERPYKVRPTSLFLPTGFLGGGKGTGLYGDVCGAIERKAPPPAPSSGAAKRRSLSLRSLTRLSRSASTTTEGGLKSPRRRSLFGLSAFAGCGTAEPSISEQPSAKEDGLRATLSRPQTSLSRYEENEARIDEFAVHAPAPSAQSTIRGPRRPQPHTAQAPGSRHEKRSESMPAPAFAALPSAPAAQPKLSRATSIRRSLSLLSGIGRRRSFAPPEEAGRKEQATAELDEEVQRRRAQRKERRRSSLGLSLSLFGREEEQPESEELDQWVAVSVR